MARLPGNLYYCILCLFAMTAALFATGCGSGFTGDLPLNRIKKSLAGTPTYSIILEDMKEEGNFVKQYYHKYKIVQLEESGKTDWLEVPEKYYRANKTFLGMSLFAKKDGEEIASVAPPGYQYVGDKQYGQWRTDHRGRSFWEFYGQYAFFSTMFGGWYRPIYRDDYRTYSRYRSQNRPYFGGNNQFGTSGSVAKKNKPDFYSRNMAGKQGFSNRVSNRIGRSRTGYRGRSGGFGK